jgi:hypothetical protein
MSWDVASIYPHTFIRLWRAPVPPAAKHTHYMMLPPPCFTDGVLRLASLPLFPPNITMVIMAQQFYFFFSLSHSLFFSLSLALFLSFSFISLPPSLTSSLNHQSYIVWLVKRRVMASQVVQRSKAIHRSVVASLQPGFRSQAVSQLAVTGSPIGWRTIGAASSGFGRGGFTWLIVL